MLCCLPRVRPALLAASEFAQDLMSIPRGRTAVSNFIDRPENLLSLPCLLYSQRHGCEDLSMVCLSWSFYCPPLLAVPACSATGPPGYCLTTHPCLTIGAHAVMVCVVMIQAHLHSLPPPCLSRLLVEPLFSLPVTFHKSPCLTWCMRRGLRPDR